MLGYNEVEMHPESKTAGDLRPVPVIRCCCREYQQRMLAGDPATRRRTGCRPAAKRPSIRQLWINCLDWRTGTPLMYATSKSSPGSCWALTPSTRRAAKPTACGSPTGLTIAVSSLSSAKTLQNLSPACRAKSGINRWPLPDTGYRPWECPGSTILRLADGRRRLWPRIQRYESWRIAFAVACVISGKRSAAGRGGVADIGRRDRLRRRRADRSATLPEVGALIVGEPSANYPADPEAEVTRRVGE